MRLGLWTPLPHVIQAEPAMDDVLRAAATRGLLPDPLPNMAGRDPALAFATEAVTTAERHGFSVTLVAERWLGPDHSAWVLATALACATTRMEIMVAAHPGIVPPPVVAKMGATLDRISGGRFSMNVVNGWWAKELDMFGGAWLPASDARYGRMDEFVQAVRALWTQDAPRLDGAHYMLDGTALPLRPVQQPCPPIYAASRSDAGKETIARYCDCWFAEYGPDFRRFDANRDQVAADLADMCARAARHGRTLRFGLSAHVIVAEEAADAVAQAEALEAYGARDPVAATAAKSLGAGLVGTPDTVAARIESYAALGIDCLMLRFHPMLAGLDNFARQVLPRLRCVTPPSPGPAPAASAAGR